MNKYFILGLISLITLISLASCSKSTEPTVILSMSEYFKATPGSWWKYDTWSTDSNGIRLDNTGKDSIYASGIINLKGKNTTLCLAFDLLNPGQPDTALFYYVEGNKLYCLMPTISAYKKPGGKLDTSNWKWVMFADLDGSNWTVINDSMIVDSMGNKSKSYYTLTGSKGIQKNYNIKGRNILCQQFIFNQQMKMYMNIFGQDLLFSDSELRVEYWFGNGVGLVNQITKVTKDMGFGFGINSEIILVDYNIK